MTRQLQLFIRESLVFWTFSLGLKRFFQSPARALFYRITKFLPLFCRSTAKATSEDEKGNPASNVLPENSLDWKLNVSTGIKSTSQSWLMKYGWWHKFIERVNTGQNVKFKTDDLLAIKILIFDINGLCTPFTIHFGYYLGIRSIFKQFFFIRIAHLFRIYQVTPPRRKGSICCWSILMDVWLLAS